MPTHSPAPVGAAPAARTSSQELPPGVLQLLADASAWLGASLDREVLLHVAVGLPIPLLADIVLIDARAGERRLRRITAGDGVLSESAAVRAFLQRHLPVAHGAPTGQGLTAQAMVAGLDGDFLGTDVVYVTRDGIVARPPDGQPDRVVFNSAGTLGTHVPDLALDMGFGRWDDYYGVVVYLVDRAGNVTRVEDADLVR